jgi:hypothetical protein
MDDCGIFGNSNVNPLYLDISQFSIPSYSPENCDEVRSDGNESDHIDLESGLNYFSSDFPSLSSNVFETSPDLPNFPIENEISSYFSSLLFFPDSPSQFPQNKNVINNLNNINSSNNMKINIEKHWNESKNSANCENLKIYGLTICGNPECYRVLEFVFSEKENRKNRYCSTECHQRRDNLNRSKPQFIFSNCFYVYYHMLIFY